jgi:hypothetical protein
VGSLPNSPGVPLLAFRSPSRISSASPSLAVRAVREHRPSASEPPPVRLFASSMFPVRGIHFPARPLVCGSHRILRALPRRGLPHPLRSVFAVFHDLDGLRLPEPCGVFQPLTPMRFASPCSLAASRWRGGEFQTRGSRSGRAPGRFSRSVARSTAPDHRDDLVRLRLPRGPRELLALPPSSGSDHPVACYSIRRPVSPGTTPFLPRRPKPPRLSRVRLRSRPVPSRVADRSRLPAWLAASPSDPPRGVFRPVRDLLLATRTRCFL